MGCGRDGPATAGLPDAERSDLSRLVKWGEHDSYLLYLGERRDERDERVDQRLCGYRMPSALICGGM